MTWINPITLVGQTVTLRPYSPKDNAALFKTLDPEILQYFTTTFEFTPEGFNQWLEKQTKGRVCFTQVLTGSGEVVGFTNYLNILEQDKTLEIGGTWLAKAYQKTKVNPEAKFLLLSHAFEVLKAGRVQIKTDSRNLQSQKAIEKLGAVKEGILRNHMLLYTGNYRHTVMYSILPEEWFSTIKPRLMARLYSQ